jgi:ABC-type bacteriocin/lantibiotic exporter with double-glycine peptidase domain
MLLGYFGRKTRLEECRTTCDPGRDGVTARTIVEAARGFGVRTKALSLEARDFSHITVPCIVHWNLNHFVVLEHWACDNAEIVDPGWGRRQLTTAEFETAFSGVALLFEPGPDFQARSTPAPRLALSCVKQILRTPGTSGILSRILAASLLLQVFGFALPLFTKLLVDRVLPHHTPGVLNMLGAGAFVIAFMSAAIGYFRSVLLIRLEARLDSHLMLGFFEHLLSLPYRFFQQRSSGDLLMRLGSNATIREALASYTTSAVLDGTLVLVFLAALAHISPLFASAVLVIALIEITILATTRQRQRLLMESDLAAQSGSQACLIESLMGITTLKASGAEESTRARWSGLLAKQLGASAQRSRLIAKIDAALTVMRVFSPLFLLWLGGIQVVGGSMSLGTMLAVNALAAAFLQPVGSLVLSAQRLQLAGAHLARIADVMQAEPEQDRCKVAPAPRLTGRIELRNVSFRYDTHAPKVLDNISFTVYPGQKVAIVGRTGSGKSTLAKLLLGLYQPTEGEILYDGIPLHAMDLQTLRSQWGTVLQDSFLFNSSLRDNISFHKPELSLRDLVAASKIAEIDSDIIQMPMGYETRVDEGGRGLSGGQRQRVALARAVAYKPPLLLLDEATSHLDVMTEARVDRNLDALSCTRVVIAHRVSAIRNAHLILVLEGGAVAEQGSHHQLLARDGHYAALISGQLKPADGDCGSERRHSGSDYSPAREDDPKDWDAHLPAHVASVVR